MAAKTTPLTVVAGELTLGSPAQQLLDRFLIGYPRGGAFHRPPFAVTLVGAAGPERDRRVKERGLHVAEGAAKVAALLVVGGDVERALAAARPGARAFVYGLLAPDAPSAARLRAQAARRKVALLAGAAVGTTWRLPEVELPAGTALDEALIVVGGKEPDRELVALDGILPLLERRARGAPGVRSVRAVAGEALFRGARRGRHLAPPAGLRALAQPQPAGGVGHGRPHPGPDEARPPAGAGP